MVMVGATSNPHFTLLWSRDPSIFNGFDFDDVILVDQEVF